MFIFHSFYGHFVFPVFPYGGFAVWPPVSAAWGRILLPRLEVRGGGLGRHPRPPEHLAPGALVTRPLLRPASLVMKSRFGVENAEWHLSLSYLYHFVFLLPLNKCFLPSRFFQHAISVYFELYMLWN
jgi:hypothetical protein